VSLLVLALKSPLPPGSKKAAASERKRKSRAKASPEKKMELLIFQFCVLRASTFGGVLD